MTASLSYGDQCRFEACHMDQALVTQSGLEYLSYEQWVAGSNPAEGTMKLHGNRPEIIEKSLAFAASIQQIDRHLSEWTTAELHCYTLAQEVKRLRREIRDDGG